jgi:hypothetical protein
LIQLISFLDGRGKAQRGRAALAHEVVAVYPDDDRWEVSWGSILLGWIDERRLDRGLILPVRRRR